MLDLWVVRWLFDGICSRDAVPLPSDCRLFWIVLILALPLGLDCGLQGSLSISLGCPWLSSLPFADCSTRDVGSSTAGFPLNVSDVDAESDLNRFEAESASAESTD